VYGEKSAGTSLPLSVLTIQFNKVAVSLSFSEDCDVPGT
jgi:hypothetical protein